MLKRLSVSLLLMGLATIGLGAGAFAWFSDEGVGDVTITAGTADLTFDVNQNCDATEEATGVDGFPFSWGGVAPGDTTTDCITINNAGTTDLDLTVFHESVDGSGVGLANDVTFLYEVPGSSCGGPANAPGFGTGCSLGSVAEGGTLAMEVTVTYQDNGDQNGQQGQDLTLDAIIYGQTP